MAMELKRQSDASMIECIDNCTDCAAICEEAVQHCLEAGGEHARPGHVGLLLDCVAICRTSAGFMIRGSDLHSETAGRAPRPAPGAPMPVSGSTMSR